MPDLSVLGTLPPYHLLTWGTLLGTEVFQSFVGGITAYRALPRAQFASLQSALFPVYFSIQTAAPVILALTYPGDRLRNVPSGPSGLIAAGDKWGTLIPVLTIFATSLSNLVMVGPWTTRVMKERKHQGVFPSFDLTGHSSTR